MESVSNAFEGAVVAIGPFEGPYDWGGTLPVLGKSTPRVPCTFDPLVHAVDVIRVAFTAGID